MYAFSHVIEKMSSNRTNVFLLLAADICTTTAKDICTKDDFVPQKMYKKNVQKMYKKKRYKSL